MNICLIKVDHMLGLGLNLCNQRCTEDDSKNDNEYIISYL